MRTDFKYNLMFLMSFYNLTTDKLSEETNIKLPILENWFSGNNLPSKINLQKISDYFDIKDSSFFYKDFLDFELSYFKTHTMKDIGITYRQMSKLINESYEFIKKNINCYRCVDDAIDYLREPFSNLLQKEKAMLEVFRKLLPETQDFILRSAQSLEEQKEAQKK